MEKSGESLLSSRQIPRALAHGLAEGFPLGGPNLLHTHQKGTCRFPSTLFPNLLLIPVGRNKGPFPHLSVEAGPKRLGSNFLSVAFYSKGRGRRLHRFAILFYVGDNLGSHRPYTSERSFLRGGCPRLVIVTRLRRFESDFSIV